MRYRSMLALLLALLLVVVIFAFLVTPSSSPSPTPSPTLYRTPTSAAIQVTYRVRGSGTAFITYRAAGGGTAQRRNVVLPWSTAFSARAGDLTYISAQNEDASVTSWVECYIYVNNRAIQYIRSEGPYTIASCSGAVDEST